MKETAKRLVWSTIEKMTIARLALSVLLVVCVAGLPIEEQENRVSGDLAKTVAPGEFPFVVSVTFNSEHICGGFIYNSRFIVTAASCVYQKSPSQIEVTLGQLSFTLPDPGEQVYQIRAIVVHENYNNLNRSNDIALLETSQDIKFNENVNYVYYNQVTPLDGPASVLGWGAIDESKVMSTKLRQGFVYPPVGCDAFPSDIFDPNTMLCWGNPEFDEGMRPCQYDEGSPLFQPISSLTDGYVVGIVSKNLGCGDSTIYETIYTKLSAYYGWFNRNAGAQPIAL